MVVVVVVPGGDRGTAGGLGVVGPHVEDFVDQEPVESFDPLAVAGRVGPGALMTCRDLEHGGGKIAGPVVRAVVGDHPHDRGDRMAGKVGAGR